MKNLEKLQFLSKKLEKFLLFSKNFVIIINRRVRTDRIMKKTFQKAHINAKYNYNQTASALESISSLTLTYYRPAISTYPSSSFLSSLPFGRRHPTAFVKNFTILYYIKKYSIIFIGGDSWPIGTSRLQKTFLGKKKNLGAHYPGLFFYIFVYFLTERRLINILTKNNLCFATYMCAYPTERGKKK